jgi:prolyl oligopeptidase
MTTRRDDLVESHFGHAVEDPYRWLEDDADPEVQAWVKTQQARARHALDAIPERPAIARRLTALFALSDVSEPIVTPLGAGAYRYFRTVRRAGDEQPKLVVRDGLKGPDRVLVDPTERGPGTALDWYSPSPAGRFVALGLSTRGTEASTLHIVDAANGTWLGDTIGDTRNASVCWTPDEASFYYTRFPARGSVPAGEEAFSRRLFHHALGADSTGDPLVFGAELAGTDYPGCVLSPDGRWLVVPVHRSYSHTDLYLADTTRRPLRFERVTHAAHVHLPIARDDVVYVLTDDGAPRFRLLAFDPERPTRSAWRVVLPEHPTRVLEHVAVIGTQLVATSAEEGVSAAHRHDREGNDLGALELPGAATTSGASGAVDGDEAFLRIERFDEPPGLWRVDLHTGRMDRWEAPATAPSTPSLAVERFEACSRDGTRVPYFVVGPACPPAQPCPVVLYGYGGFGVSVRPSFNRAACVLAEHGVLYVQAVLRGGGERGRPWHLSGNGLAKQNVFDDFIAVAEDLVARGLTCPNTLGIWGRSNGGLLTTAVLTQRPELFRAAVAEVPLADMVRYPRFLLGNLWVSEYGSPDEPETFAALHAYSPYHRADTPAPYPAVLLTTADHDSRVHPLHARKMAAALQASTTSGRPVLLRTNAHTGHGAGTPVSGAIDEVADVLAFLLWQLCAGPGGRRIA